MAESITEGLFFDELMVKCEKIPDFKVITFENGEYPNEPLSYANLFENISKVAKWLKSQGIGKGDSFSLVMRNHPEFLYCLGQPRSWGQSSSQSIRGQRGAS